MFNPDEPVLSIKDEPELRHALAHLYYAIEAAAKGQSREALYELKSIESLIFWEDDNEMSRYVNGEQEMQSEAEELQGQEELQRKAVNGKGATAPDPLPD